MWSPPTYITKEMDIEAFITTLRQLGDYWIKLVRLPKYH